MATASEMMAREEGNIEDALRRTDELKRRADSTRVVLAVRDRQARTSREEATRLAPALKQARALLETARQQLSDLSVEEREVSVRLSDLVARARDEMSVSPAELAGPSEVPEEVEDLDAEIANLTRKLSSLGGVNMEALQELDELESRHAFLAKQRDDLVDAKESLEKLIAKTRATSRRMFLDNFETVKEHFSSIFRRIFGGGKADCVLVDPDDVLESPIQIFAKPPGKELSQLTLLSGGEKAMTAVSLLFAMFSTRPSPFLILDEVDAPMDESNIGRFLDLMRDFLPISQFVVITHSRKTMAAADTLYGITMEEQGVSKKVSVSFRQEATTLEPVSA
jgi:chromosome segregation protein